jgi:hypothetical protein
VSPFPSLEQGLLLEVLLEMHAKINKQDIDKKFVIFLCFFLSLVCLAGLLYTGYLCYGLLSIHIANNAHIEYKLLSPIFNDTLFLMTSNSFIFLLLNLCSFLYVGYSLLRPFIRKLPYSIMLSMLVILLGIDIFELSIKHYMLSIFGFPVHLYLLVYLRKNIFLER